MYFLLNTPVPTLIIPTYLSIEKTNKHRKRKPHQTTMPIRLDNNGKRKALICEELKPETRYEEHVRIEEEKDFKKQRKNKHAINKMKKQGKLRSISGFLVVS